MAKLSSVNKNNRRIKLSKKYLTKRNKLKKIIMDKKISLEERFRHNKNYQSYLEIRLKLVLLIDVKLQEDPMACIEN